MRPDDHALANPYVFVVGCARSGTTLLQRMLDAHPLLAVANDSHFIPRAVADLPVDADPDLTPELVEWVRSYRRFYRLDLADAAVDEAAAGATTYSEFVAALYTEYARLRGKRLAGEKTPDYVRSLPRLHHLFPSARVVHIIRDGRDVTLSTLGWAKDGKGPSKMDLWDEEPVAVCALWWRSQVKTGGADGRRLASDSYHEVRYEKLVAEPEEQLRMLAQFLDLPDAPEMAAYHVGKTKNNPKLSAKSAWLPPTGGLRDWRSSMSVRDRALFEALAGDLLEKLGYQRSIDTVPADVAETAERCRAWWDTRRQRGAAPAAPA